MKKYEKSVEIGGRELTLTTGNLAQQAHGAVMAKYGETVAFATVVASEMAEDRGYFPLSVDYQERLYAGGRIKGSRWVKREGRPTDEEILTGRLIDRSIRPLFPHGYKRDVQVIVTVMSVDLENDPKFVAANAVSAAIAISQIPWSGPVSVMSIGTDAEGKYIANVLDSNNADTKMELVVSSTKEAIVMIEAGANEVDEKVILGGIEHAHKESQKLLAFINDFAKEAGVKKEKFEEAKAGEAMVKKVSKVVNPMIDSLVDNMSMKAEGVSLKEVQDAVAESVEEGERGEALAVFDKIFKEHIRKMILSGKRPDGRGREEIRELSSEVGVLPRTHGSAIFNRGQTQVLNIATLGSPSLGQLIETAEGEEEKRYIHHYSMPPFSVGETGRVGFASRREIGHGALAERALMPVIPGEQEFPYTIRLVSEAVSSNGSTSMASTCASTLSLMDAGVPIHSPVSGIAMGLVVESAKKYAILSDIAGIEDFNGDMDFKVAGTEKGVTAMQLDVKTLSLTVPILKEALAQAKAGRALILKSMLATISEPRAELSIHAPKIKTVKIEVDKIGELIGPGGKIIKKLIADTGAQIDVSDDGTVHVSGIDSEGVKQALEAIENITKEVVAGEVYEGEVVRIENFGAFVNILPGRDGMVHVSDMSTEYVADPKEVVSIGDKVQVRVKEIDNMKRINLSMVMDAEYDKKKESRARESRPPRRNSGGHGGRRHEKDAGGPHFPASRLASKKGDRRF